jgi:hypothetical protein
MVRGLHVREGQWRRRLVTPRWLLGGVLAVQVAASGRLVWSNTAFSDEALYLWAGRLEWAHWLHGAPVPAFATYFSGAPVLYPPLAALAERVGGLTGARLLSLCFMLGATSLLWATTSRLRGQRAAFFASALFVALGPTQFLGAFATYDAMALFLMALAAWSVTRAALDEERAGWFLVGIAALVLANATKYASALFDPVVVGMAALAAWPRIGAKRSAARAGLLAAYVAAALAVALLLGSQDYVKGVLQTTLARAAGTAPASSVLLMAWGWSKTVVVIAAFGAATAWRAERVRAKALLLTVLAAAALLAPVEEARLHTTVALQKHVDFGAWFAAVTAGYAIDRRASWAGGRRAQAWSAAACAAALLVPANAGAAQARALYGEWANSARLAAVMQRFTAEGDGPILMDNPSIGEFYSPAGAQWWRWSSTGSVRFALHVVTAARVGGILPAGTFQPLIASGYFTTIALTPSDRSGLDTDITADLRRNHGYHLAAQVPYGRSSYDIWIYRNGTSRRSYGTDSPPPPTKPILSLLSLEGRTVMLCSAIVIFFGGLVRMAWRRRKRLQDL